jgi:hypothetical protein
MADEVSTTFGGQIKLGRQPANTELLVGNTTGDFALTTASALITPFIPATPAPPTNNIGYLNIPINSQSAAYSTVLLDSGKAILHPDTDNFARTFTIDNSVVYDFGTVITFINRVNTVTIALSGGTLILAGLGSTGNRTLAANGLATAIKIGSTVWMISGSGLT